MTSLLLAVGKTLAIAALGGMAFRLLGVPLAWMLGALTITIVAAQLIPDIQVPRAFREVLQPILGVALGSYFTPAIAGHIGSWPEVMAFLVAYVVVAALFGLFYFRKIAGFDPITAFFSSVPGGLGDLTLIGASMGANIVLLGLVHTIRVVLVVVTMPFLMALLVGSVAPPLTHAPPSVVFDDYLVLLICGAGGYAMARLVRIPAGPMLWPLAFSAAAHMWPLTESSPPPGMVSAVQVVLGAYIGARFGSVQWRDFRNALMHGLIWACGLMIIATGFAWVCAWATGFRFTQLLLAFAPGGLAEMGLLTLALGIDVALVTTCHVARLMLVYCIVPFAARRAKDVPANVKDNGLNDD